MNSWSFDSHQQTPLQLCNDNTIECSTTRLRQDGTPLFTDWLMSVVGVLMCISATSRRHSTVPLALFRISGSGSSTDLSG